jgi:2',3'-cyclic-nucleotide 2'-phosphodiesterase (5'-nucleotidase family)
MNLEGKMKVKISVLFIVGILMIFFPLSISIKGLIYSNNLSEVKSEDEWSFIVIGDTHQQYMQWDYELGRYPSDNTTNPIRRALFNEIVEKNPNLEFIVHTGDIVSAGAEQDDWNRYYEDIENVTSNNISIYYAVGNHDYYNYASNPLTFWPRSKNLSTFLTNVDLPGNERYYSFNYKNSIHFVFINTEENFDWNNFTITSDQASWLIDDLENTAIDFIIAIFHRPMYSIRNSPSKVEAQRVRNTLESLFLKYGVDLVFSGHDHYYFRTNRSGIVNIISGGGGATLNLNGDMEEWLEGDRYFSNYHYCNVSVKQNLLTIKAYNYNISSLSSSLADTVQMFMNKSTQVIPTNLTSTQKKVGFPPYLFLMFPLFSAMTILRLKWNRK